MLNLNYNRQVIFLIITSFVVGVLFNILRENGISWIAQSIEQVEHNDELNVILSKPSIREVDLVLAKTLHERGVLFVDARSIEYLIDGFIPGAIAHNDLDSLSGRIIDIVQYNMDLEFVIYCSDDDCGSSEDLAYSLQELGFNNILVFKGGWKSWEEAGYKVQKNE